MIRSAGLPPSIKLMTAGLALFVGACAAPELHFNLETTAYRSFPSTARVQKTCVIEVTGMSEFSQRNRGQLVSFDPQSILRKGLAHGLQQTCRRTTTDPHAADPDALALAREIWVVADVTAVSLRRGPYEGGLDEVELVATITLYRAGAPPLTKVVEGRSVQLASFYDVASAISLAIVDAVDRVNQLIFDNRASVRPSADRSREE